MFSILKKLFSRKSESETAKEFLISFTVSVVEPTATKAKSAVKKAQAAKRGRPKGSKNKQK